MSGQPEGAVTHADSDQLYRARLAAILKNISGDLLNEADDLLRQYRCGEEGIRSVSVDKLVDLLKRHPDIQSRLAQLTQYTTSKWLLEQELRARCGSWEVGDTDAYQVAERACTVGVCFSGGGIRSATFNLGVLQGLAQLGRLRDIDYLSTVSGGGYIHQFLASWTRRLGMDKVQEKLRPVPTSHSKQVIAPEPIRWLRRYSNYLSPSVNVLGPDIWTMAEVWIRNTSLNLVILLSFLTFLFCAPWILLTDTMKAWRPSNELQVGLVGFGIVVALAASGLLAYSFPRYVAAAERLQQDPVEAERERGELDAERAANDRTRAWHANVLVCAWLIIAVFLAPVVFRLSVPGGKLSSKEAGLAYQAVPAEAAPRPAFYISASDSKNLTVTPCLATDRACPPVKKDSQSRLVLGWNEFRPLCMVPLLGRKQATTDGPEHSRCVSYRAAYASHQLRDGMTGVEKPLVWLYDSFPILSAVFCASVVGGRKKTLRFWQRDWLLGSLLSVVFVSALVYGVEVVFFALTFTVRTENVVALGMVVIPALLVAIPFIALELSTAFMGSMFASAHREWTARLRAVSFLIGSSWLILGLLAFLGPCLMRCIAATFILKYALWGSWLASSATGVLLGRSRSTSGKSNQEQGGAGSFDAKEWIVKITPLIFILGLFLILATAVEWLLRGSDTSHIGGHSLLRWLILISVSVGTTLLFGWRIDVNEFSMNAFYRDRLARCYAGASNPNRRPNRFTGFAVDDASLRVADLLPLGWETPEKIRGTYEGPFPIFCSAINLTTGRDLAYQERKAASFAFTPLYSGYSTGWTDGDNCSLRYNGFVRTTEHVKRGKGITMASAVAISGAAAAPNMGFHSNPAMAFLMTVFNVRLGWWIRNTRVVGADYPRLGLFQLLNELRGKTDDTSRYVYLSDGGHFENMGLHELLRRRCRRVLVCDAEADGNLCFEGIGQAIRKARIDLGIEIRITSTVDKPSATDAISLPTPTSTAASEPSTENPTGVEGLLQFKHFPGNAFHALEGEILYPECPDKPGKILYIKSILTGDEPSDVLNYHRMHPRFPFDTTLNQFYTESQFESYRRLGEHIVDKKEIREWIVSNLKSDCKSMQPKA